VDHLQGPDEHLRILDGDVGLQSLAAVDQVIALDHVQLVAVRGAVVVDESLGVLADGVDHQGVAFVVPDRLAVP